MKNSNESSVPSVTIMLNRQTKIVMGVIIIISILLVAGVYRLYKTSQIIKPTVQTVSNEVEQLIKKIGSLIDLPSNEVPTAATVSDINKLKNQPFFARAQNGDKVLIYSQNKKAILYRPSTNKIVEVAPININISPTVVPVATTSALISPSMAVSPMLSVTPTPVIVKVAVNNGSKIKGLATTKANYLKTQLTNIEISSLGNTKNDYSENLVINLTGNNIDTVTQVAKAVEGRVVVLPAGETAPQADILVIAGK